MSIIDDTKEPAESEVFRGHLDECLRHLKRCLEAHFPKGLSGAKKARKPIADFCNVDVSTVKEWLDRPGFAAGEKRARLVCYLSLLGYHVIEFEKLKPHIRGLNELIGYSLMTVAQATELLGLGGSKNHVYDIMLSKRSVSTERIERLLQAIRERKKQLVQKKEEARAKYQLNFSLTDSIRQRKVSAVTSIMEGLVSLLESNEIGDAFANSLRDLLPPEKNTLLRLSEKLNELSVKLAKGGQEGSNG